MHPLFNFLTLLPATLVLSFGIFALCIAGARYLERAKAPDAIDLGLRLSVPGKSFWLGLQGSKEKTDSKKGPLVSPDDGPFSKN